MMKNVYRLLSPLAAVVLALFFLSGCATMGGGSEDETTLSQSEGISGNAPYFPTSFNDFEVPGELEMERKETMFINTASFIGGIVHFSGRVDARSLTDFFINSMQKNGWKMTGEVRYENILLAFTKPNKNCIIKVSPGDFATKTRVYAYITEDVLAQ